MIGLQVGFVGLQLYREIKSFAGVFTFHVPWKHHVYIIIMLKHMLSFRVEPENETILVEQVLKESPVVTGFDNCATNPEPEIINEGKPRFMH